jgi:hypothetical protein
VIAGGTRQPANAGEFRVRGAAELFISSVSPFHGVAHLLDQPPDDGRPGSRITREDHGLDQRIQQLIGNGGVWVWRARKAFPSRHQEPARSKEECIWAAIVSAGRDDLRGGFASRTGC